MCCDVVADVSLYGFLVHDSVDNNAIDGFPRTLNEVETVKHMLFFVRTGIAVVSTIYFIYEVVNILTEYL